MYIVMHHSVNSYMIDLWSTQEKESSKIENHEKFQSLQCDYCNQDHLRKCSKNLMNTNHES